MFPWPPADREDQRARPPGMAAAGVMTIGAALHKRAGEYADMDGSARLRRLAEEMYQVPIVVPPLPIAAGNGALQIMDPSGPNTGYYWSVRRVQVQGFTAGSVLSYRNPTLVGGTLVGTPEVVAPFPQQGVFTFGRGELLLNPNDWVGWTATGITLSAAYPFGVQIQGTADCFPTWLLPEYLM